MDNVQYGTMVSCSCIQGVLRSKRSERMEGEARKYIEGMLRAGESLGDTLSVTVEMYVKTYRRESKAALTKASMVLGDISIACIPSFKNKSKYQSC